MKIDWDNVLPIAGRMPSWKLQGLHKRRRDIFYLAWGPAVLMVDLPKRMFTAKPAPIQINLREQP